MLKTDISGIDPDQWFDFSEHFTSSELRAILSHNDGVQPKRPIAETRSRLISALEIESARVAIPHQVHGAHVEIARPGQIHQHTDGLFTQERETVLTLQVADCSPMYFNHPKSGWRGLVHAGWRGAASGIMDASLDLLKSVGCEPAELEVVIGNCIGQECYEVGPEVVANFPADVWTAGEGDRAQLDLSAALMGQLVAGGVRLEKIYTSPICTKCDERCHSFRRDGIKAGRMIALQYYAEEELI
ncbi:polyphenol oxidase family protein [Candidatus Neomarinimicrobiota bacterium]